MPVVADYGHVTLIQLEGAVATLCNTLTGQQVEVPFKLGRAFGAHIFVGHKVSELVLALLDKAKEDDVLVAIVVEIEEAGSKTVATGHA